MNGEPKTVHGETSGGDQVVFQEFTVTMRPPTPEEIARPRYNMPDRRWMMKQPNADASPTNGETMAIIPTTKCLFLCDDYRALKKGKVTLHGLFHAIRPAGGYPHVMDEFCVFAQLGSGLGTLPCRVEIRSAETNELVYETHVQELHFRDRHSIVQMVVRIQGCQFNERGPYILNLLCDNIWVGDTMLELR